jgi:signal transduction histidine kinase
MKNLNWFYRHRTFYISIAAATLYFAVEPVFRHFYFEFSPKDFIVVHTLFESISIIIAFMCFGITFHSRKMAGNGQNLFLGVAFLSIGILDIFHTLSYHGMPDFITPNSVNKATQLWIMARLVGAAAFLAAAFIRPDRTNRFVRPLPLMVVGLAIPAAVMYLVVLHPGSMPAMFVDGVGLTPLKIRLEYLVVAMETAAALVFFRMYTKTHEDHLVYFIGAMALGIFSELFFTLYASPYDVFNLMGHVYKVGSYLFVYQMLFVTSISSPYTALSNAKDVLREYSGHLEDMVLERTWELADTNKELMRLAKLKDEFIAMCSHDMRSPLQSSILLIELLLDETEGPLSDDQKQSLEAVMANEYSQLELVTNLLELARHEQGGLKLELSDVDINNMLEGWISRHRVVAEKKGIDLTIDIGGELSGVRWPLDKFKMGRVMDNLASNALKFTPAGGSIKASAGKDPDGLLRVSVFNSGPAIPEQELGPIFDRFHSSSVSGASNRHGFGLGLNIVKVKVELHGGRVWAQSEEGVGNTFTFTIPRAQEN